MQNAILIHGWNTRAEYYDESRPTASNDHWFPWLTKQLVVKDINTVSIEMPNGYYPEYEIWQRELERYTIQPNTILVGHSCGGGFLVRWLSENNVKVGKVVLVAPWLGYDTGNEPFDSAFFDFKIDRDIAEKTSSLNIFVSDDDMPSIHKSVKDILSSVDNVKQTTFTNKGHFTLESLKSEQFPELLEELLQ